MKLKTAAAVLCILLLCTGCAAQKLPAEDSSQSGQTTAFDLPEDSFRNEHTFITDLPEEDLQKPESSIASLEDYIYALDYLAFYRIGEKVFFDIDPQFAEEIYNPYTIHQKAYEMANLADVYACQMDDSYYSERGVIGIKYSMSKDIASNAPETIPDTKAVPSFDYKMAETEDASSEKNETTEEGSATGKRISCENSEQLYYLVMNGYQPVPVEGSMAETLYEEANAVLTEQIRQDMTDFQKIKAIYDWLTTEVVYDRETAYSAETYLVKEQAYYLEGVLLNHCAVCDGKAKAYALLLNMAGIPCVRTTGVNEGGDHAWNMVQLDGTWYLSCATYGQANMADSIGRIVPNYSMLLAGKNTPYEWYPAQKYPDIESQLSEDPFPVYRQMGEDAGLSLEIAELNELKTMLEQAELYRTQPNTAGMTEEEEITGSPEEESTGPTEEYKVEFKYTGNEKKLFEEELAAYLDAFPDAQAAEVPCEDGCAYQIIFLNGE